MTKDRKNSTPMNESKNKPTITRRGFHRTMAAVFTAASARRVLGANDKINIGVIGCGGRSYAHIHTILKLIESGANVAITAVCDIYRPRLEKAKAATNGQGTMRHEELLSFSNVDVVVAAGPDHWHGYHALDAMNAGKDVYCEKPLCHWRQTELPKRLVATAKETKRLIQVGTQWMSNPAYAKAKQLIADGAIGKPIMAETGYYRVGDWGERGMPIDDPNAKPGPDLDWERFLGDSPRREFDVSRVFRWRMYWDYAGGPATDLYPHPFTPVAYMLDLDYPECVVCTGGKHRYEEREVPDTCNMIIDYAGGLTVLVTGTQGNDYSAQGTALRPILRGWDGTLTFEENDIVIRPTEGSSIKEQRIPADFGERFTEFWTTFLDCCRNRTQPKANIELGAKVQIAMQMGIAALRGRRAVFFDRERQEIMD
ncbi:MAG: Gfo/Idh/MocA family oxidoreductase [Candidatus Omnitrophota bacterium]